MHVTSFWGVCLILVQMSNAKPYSPGLALGVFLIPRTTRKVALMNSQTGKRELPFQSQQLESFVCALAVCIHYV